MRFAIVDESGRLYDPNDKILVFANDREEFNNLLQGKLKREVFIEHLDSQQNTIVSLPDFVAGAFRLEFTKGQNEFSTIVKDLVKDLTLTTWKQLKQKEKVKA